MQYTDVLTFWFDDLTPQQWFAGGDDIDHLIAERFAILHQQAAHGELGSWRSDALGRLSEVIVLDQFSRNLYRGQALSFACDGMALVLAQEAIAMGLDKELSAQQRTFLYMPFMHSESLVIHEQAVALFQANGNELNLDFELRHKAIIERFGRYPHRNAILGRESTPEELTFLQEPGSSF
ncbi:DUF924 domain-containing protein [Vibrio sp. ZSDZ34]|jgi:uncharacterized protein (DUF924 family)|uniref:DUF924 domain-containing protein n=1 Tax=Vibrio gelatinilyticus TaxID=2893468 RepID=A0A9X1W7M6_9VIBR|nr:DUF924 family protein [Vibrio gelatinilyticus]MCJ2375947.1 DUF924 domain-containing protein [Vibrio gelatinilyticus]